MSAPLNRPRPGASLDKNLRRSLLWSNSQREVANLICKSHPKELVKTWKQMRDRFDRDSSKPNPYEEVESGATNLLPSFLIAS